MVPHLAVGVLAAGADTRVLAVVVEAGQAGRALRVILAVTLPIDRIIQLCLNVLKLTLRAAYIVDIPMMT